MAKVSNVSGASLLLTGKDWTNKELKFKRKTYFFCIYYRYISREQPCKTDGNILTLSLFSPLLESSLQLPFNTSIYFQRPKIQTTLLWQSFPSICLVISLITNFICVRASKCMRVRACACVCVCMCMHACIHTCKPTVMMVFLYWLQNLSES